MVAMKSIPSDIDLVVGSPPCTEFSYSNRGGGGDLSEGLKDIVRFLEIVDHLRPPYWILENVPRVAPMIRDGLKTKGHPLFRFRHLQPEVHVVNFAAFGLPQARHRCLVGNIPFEVLHSYTSICTARTLGQVIETLGKDTSLTDPIWGYTVARIKVSETEPEPHLDNEQLRMNREAKCYHPVYNDMSFPDRLDAPARTVTATCTRVSRESIVIEDLKSGHLRRLTVRERASLQSFPLSYQFLAKSHSSKVKMIGNAVPPLFSFMVGMASLEKTCSAVERRLDMAPEITKKLKAVHVPNSAPPHKVTESYPEKRRFRAAIPGLRFKSGMRFELANNFGPSGVRWRVRFFHGPSTNIQTIPLNGHLYRRTRANLPENLELNGPERNLSELRALLSVNSARHIQDVWTRRSSGVGPFELTDLLGHISGLVKDSLEVTVDRSDIDRIVLRECGYNCEAGKSSPKIVQYAYSILAGFITGSFFNQTASERPKAVGPKFKLEATSVPQTKPRAGTNKESTNRDERDRRTPVRVLRTSTDSPLTTRSAGAF
jgi:DNA (cytosine-5)-methyltransferase 1